MTVLALHQDLFSAGLPTHCDNGHGSGMTGVLANDGLLPLNDDNVVLDHVDDATAPHDFARCNLVGAWLIRDGCGLGARQEMHEAHSHSTRRCGSSIGPRLQVREGVAQRRTLVTANGPAHPFIGRQGRVLSH